MVTGAVNHVGGIAHGSGFSVVKTSDGRYTVTFTTAFADVPLVLARPQNVDVTLGTHNVSASGFEVELNATPGTATDAGFFFSAQDYI